MAARRRKSAVKRRVHKKQRRQRAAKELKALTYYTLSIGKGKTLWNTDGKARRTSGVFKSPDEAIKWALENLGADSDWNLRKTGVKRLGKHEKLNPEW